MSSTFGLAHVRSLRLDIEWESSPLSSFRFIAISSVLPPIDASIDDQLAIEIRVKIIGMGITGPFHNVLNRFLFGKDFHVRSLLFGSCRQ